WNARPYSALAPGRSCSQAEAFALLKVGHDGGEVVGLRVAAGRQHSHQALGRFVCGGAELVETNGRVDVIAQHRRACSRSPLGEEPHETPDRAAREPKPSP